MKKYVELGKYGLKLCGKNDLLFFGNSICIKENTMISYEEHQVVIQKKIGHIIIDYEIIERKK